MSYGYVVDLVHRGGIGSGRREQVRLHGVGDVAEVPAGLAVPIDVDRLIANHRGNPFWNHGRISPLGVLARTENIEISQANRGETVGAREDIGIQLVRELADRIRR